MTLRVVLIIAAMLVVVSFANLANVYTPCGDAYDIDGTCTRCVKVGRRGGCSGCEATNVCKWIYSPSNPLEAICVRDVREADEANTFLEPTDAKWGHAAELCPQDAAKEPILPIQEDGDIKVQDFFSHAQESVVDIQNFCDFRPNYVVDRFARTFGDYSSMALTVPVPNGCFRVQRYFGLSSAPPPPPPPPPPGPPPPAGPFSVSVDATKGPSYGDNPNFGQFNGATGSVPTVQLLAGTVYDITATGVATDSGAPCPKLTCVGPDGGGNFVGPHEVFFPVNNPAPTMALIGSCDKKTWFLIGSSKTLSPNALCPLYLGLNDYGYGDNKGSYSVTITPQNNGLFGGTLAPEPPYVLNPPIPVQTEADLLKVVSGGRCRSTTNPYSTAHGRECIRRMQSAYCSQACPEYGKAQGLFCPGEHMEYLYNVCQDWSNGIGGVPFKGCPLDPSNLAWDDTEDRFCDDDLQNVHHSGFFESEFGLY